MKMREILSRELDREMVLVIMIFTIGVIAAAQKEWNVAGTCITGAFAILKLSSNSTSNQGVKNEKADSAVSTPTDSGM